MSYSLVLILRVRVCSFFFRDLFFALVLLLVLGIVLLLLSLCDSVLRTNSFALPTFILDRLLW